MAGPLNTMSRSSGVSSLNGTLVRTPIAPHTCFIRSHMSEPHGSTAPSSILFDSSGTRAARFTSRTMPVPEQVGQAPAELKASDSAPGAWNSLPQPAQVMGSPAATFSVDSLRAPQCGHTCEATRENRSRRLLSSSVIVPNVERMPGTVGRWCRASAAGTCSTSSTWARLAWVRRRRVYVDSASK